MALRVTFFVLLGVTLLVVALLAIGTLNGRGGAKDVHLTAKDVPAPYGWKLIDDDDGALAFQRGTLTASVVAAEDLGIDTDDPKAVAAFSKELTGKDVLGKGFTSSALKAAPDINGHDVFVTVARGTDGTAVVQRLVFEQQRDRLWVISSFATGKRTAQTAKLEVGFATAVTK